MRTAWVFDNANTERLSQSRQEFLDPLVRSLRASVELRTALDAGCGIGYFSGYLVSLGLTVSAFDGREENIGEARRRYPSVEFSVEDVEDKHVRGLGKFDLVLCFGLLYHLENPFVAIRNLFELTGSVLVVETMIDPRAVQSAVMIDEGKTEDQGLNYIAVIPSQSGLIKMLYCAGFQYVYSTLQLPDHSEFQETATHWRRRTIIVASKTALKAPLVQLIPEPHLTHNDIWSKRTLVATLVSKGPNGLAARVWQSIHYRVLGQIPLPIRLSWGGWLFAGDDVISRQIRRGKGFEDAEQRFLIRFLQPGMTVLDIGAHFGLYTLLARKCVGRHGRVIAFEPSPREQRRLRLHLFMNGIFGLRIEPVALGELDGTADLYVPQGRATSFNSLRPPAVSEPIKRIRVPVLMLDGYLAQAQIQAVDFIKIDAEGAELGIFKGATALLSKQPRPVLMCEIDDTRSQPWGYPSVAIYDLLTEHSYRWFAITTDGHLQPAPRQDYFNYVNLLAVPEERIALVSAFMEVKPTKA